MPIAGRVLALLGVVFILQKLGAYIHKILREKLTAVEDIALLGLPRKQGKIQGTAVICGGSIAGLLSARVCSDHFEKVIIVEPEAWLSTEEGQRDRHRENFVPGSIAPKRSRVIQYTAIHLYQRFTTQALRKLFSDFDYEIKRAGGLLVPIVNRFHLSGVPWVGYYNTQTDDMPTALYATRPAYETGLRKLVLNHCPNVKYVVGSVTGLVLPRSGNTIESVTVHAHSEDNAATNIPATMVVDCTGPAQGGLRWLKGAGFHALSAQGNNETPASLDTLRVTYDPKVAYTTCEFNIPSVLYEKFKAIFLPIEYEKSGPLFIALTVPRRDRLTYTIQRRDANYLQIMCGGADFKGKITSISELRKFISERVVDQPLPKFVSALIDFLEEHDIPMTYVHPRISPRSYVQYFRAPHLPSNFVALGDAVLQSNPIRGQGCTSTCVDAVTLNGLLARTTTDSSCGKSGSLPPDFGRKFFALQSKRSGGMWEAQKPGDYMWSSTIPQPGDNPNSRVNRFKGWYGFKMMQLGTKDDQFTHIFSGVENYMAPLTDLFLPVVIAKIVLLQVTQTLGLKYPGEPQPIYARSK